MDGAFIVNNPNSLSSSGVYGNPIDGSFAVTSASNPDHQELAKMEAPTTSKSNGVKKPDSSKVIMDYSTDFPKLPEALPAPLPSKGAWGRQPVIQSTVMTEAFKLSANERASRGLAKTFGNTNDEQQKCNQIAQQTGTKIELCEAKDQSLTILITGKRQNVEQARTYLVRELQTQASIEVNVPKDHHGFIIGKEGGKLRSLEHEFFCRIYMPGRDEKSEIIRIVGPNEHIIEAAKKISELSNEMAKNGTEELDIPRTFYPWIRGPFNENVESIISRYAVKVNIPPAGKNEVIIITGEKNGVEKAADEIRQIYESKKQFKTLTCKVNKTQHRFINGTKRSGIEEILRETDVVIDIPAEDDDSDIITLRGPQERLGDALALVYSRASSVVSAEIKHSEWMRRFLIGPKGSKLQSLIPQDDRLKVDFEDGGIIYIEGPPEAVKTAHSSLSNEISRLDKEMASIGIKVPPALHRHIIGRNGAQVNKLKEENDVQISVPGEKMNSDEIRVEGRKDGVENVRKAILEIVERLENEKSRDIIIPHRFHGQIIGKNGESIQKWRKEFPSVLISFPDATDKCDIVNLRGEKKEVDKLYAVMTKLTKELELSNYQGSVSIFKDYYKHIIGKSGANINKIREETQTRIELPSGGDGRITVIGRQENVEKAIAMLNKIQNELASIIATEVSVPNRLHSRLLSGNRRLIRDIEDEFGGVHILFPKDKGSDKDKVTIRGPKDDVNKAEIALKELVKHCEQTTDEVIIETKPEYIKFLIGRDGAKVKKLREKYGSVRIVFPTEPSHGSQIVLAGKKEEVEAVKKIYLQQIAELNETIEIQLRVDPKHHRHFIIRGAEVLKEIQSHNGNCIISFPRQESNDSTVTIKGSKSCVESAKARIEEIVSDIESQVTINICIPEEHHRTLMSHLNDIRSHYNVRIKIPDRGTTNDSGPQIEGIGLADLIQITGRREKCEEAKLALNKLIPISKSITVPLEYHSSFIGRGGEAVKALMSDHAVRIKIPSAVERSEEIVVTGTPENVETCFAEIREKIEELDRQAEDRRLRSHRVTIDVPMKYHQRLIGPRGANVREISDRHGVQISIPRMDANKSDTETGTITIIGYEQKCNECADEIRKTIADLESMIIYEVKLDVRFHPRLIGQRGRNLRKIEEDFKVEIQMPGRNAPHPEVVVVGGKDEGNVCDCVDKLRAMEEDYITELIDRGAYSARKEEPKREHVNAPQMEITGAPWQLDSLEQFPVVGSTTAVAAQGQTVNASWGARR